MREWLGKPLLILAAIVVVLGGLSVCWLNYLPSRADAAGIRVQAGTDHQKQVDQAYKAFDDR